MGLVVIKQPDDRLAVWTTVSDDFVLRDATAEEVIEFFVERSAEETRRAMTPLVEGISETPYGQAQGWFTGSFEDALDALHAKALWENEHIHSSEA